MLAAAILATTPGNHANAINNKTAVPDSATGPQMVRVDEDLQLLGGPGPVVDGQTKP